MTVCCSDCATEQTGESANVFVLQGPALPTSPPCHPHWRGIVLVMGRSHTQAERPAPICSRTHTHTQTQYERYQSNVKFLVMSGTFITQTKVSVYQAEALIFNRSLCLLTRLYEIHYFIMNDYIASSHAKSRTIYLGVLPTLAV